MKIPPEALFWEKEKVPLENELVSWKESLTTPQTVLQDETGAQTVAG